MEYYILTKGNLWITYVYNGNKSNPYYWYHKGVNIQSFMAYLAGIALPFPGFCGSLGASVSQTAINIGYIGWLLSLFVSAFVYWSICLVWPTPPQKAVKEQGLRWEELQYETTLVLGGTFSQNAISRVKFSEGAKPSLELHKQATEGPTKSITENSA